MHSAFDVCRLVPSNVETVENDFNNLINYSFAHTASLGGPESQVY